MRRVRRLDNRGSLRHLFGALVVVLLIAAAAAAYLGWIPASDDDSGTSPALDEPPAVVAGVDLPDPASPADVLTGVSPPFRLPVTAVRRLVEPALGSRDLGRHTAFVAASLDPSGERWVSTRNDMVTPASTLKLLTALVALDRLGPEHRFATTVVTGRRPREVVLVGGGDPLLTDRTPRPAEAADLHPLPASLETLAQRTAEALRRQGVRRVALSYDASLFTGPAINPHWEPSYVTESVVSPTTALWVDEGRRRAGFLRRVEDPALTAARRFALLLAKQGIAVPKEVAAAPAPESAGQLARVESAPLDQIVQHVLEASDNEAAEVLLRQIALAVGRPGSSSAGVTEVVNRLHELGVPTRRGRIYDGSGLSRDNRLPVSALVDVLQVAAGPEHPDLRPVVSALPVAGFTGSLAYRFVEDAPAGLGVVRGKTGTLSGVHGLAGVTVTRLGTPILFAAVADRVPLPKTLDARDQLDRVAAILTRCSC